VPNESGALLAEFPASPIVMNENAETAQEICKLLSATSKGSLD
jgi:hypothetical protein